MPRRARERDDVADVGHPGCVDDGALEPQAEAGVRHGAVAAQIAVPPVDLWIQVQFGQTPIEVLKRTAKARERLEHMFVAF